MPQQCSICTGNKREGMDIELVNGISIRDIAVKFQVSRSAVGRHRKACHQAIIASTMENSKAAELLEAAKQSESEVSSLTRADEMFRRTRKAVIEAFKRKDYRIAFGGLREARGYLELIAKMSGEFDAEPSARIHRPMFILPEGSHVSCVFRGISSTIPTRSHPPIPIASHPLFRREVIQRSNAKPSTWVAFGGTLDEMLESSVIGQ